MKHIFKLILILIFFVSSLKADAVVYSSSQIKENISKQLVVLYKQQTDAKIVVSSICLPFKDLDLPKGNVKFVVKLNSQKFTPRDVEKVFVYVNGNLYKAFSVPIVVKAYQNVLVASEFINIGQEISPRVVTVKNVEVSNTYGYQLKAENASSGMISRKAFREGEVIDKRFVKIKPEVQRNSNVIVIFDGNNLSITTDAIALSDGVLGETICLMNRTYNRTYKGKVIGENKVLVKI